MSEILCFKDVPVRAGEVIAIEFEGALTDLITSDPVEVAVLDVDTDGSLMVLVPSLLCHQANKLRIMPLLPESIRSIEVVSSAEEAVPERSGLQHFQFNERVTFLAGGDQCEGRVIAALEGLVAICTDHGDIRVNVAKHFERLPASIHH